VYYALFFVAMHLLLFAVYVAVPAMVFVVTAYVSGAFKIRSMMQALLTESLQGDRNDHRQTDKLRRAMHLAAR
jgi:hypothetical protein